MPCHPCLSTGVQLDREGNPVECPMCKGTTERIKFNDRFYADKKDTNSSGPKIVDVNNGLFHNGGSPTLGDAKNPDLHQGQEGRATDGPGRVS